MARAYEPDPRSLDVRYSMPAPRPISRAALWTGWLLAAVLLLALTCYAVSTNPSRMARNDMAPATSGSTVTNNGREVPTTSGSDTSTGHGGVGGPVQQR